MQAAPPPVPRRLTGLVLKKGRKLVNQANANGFAYHDRFGKYHEILSNLSKDMPGLYLDFDARIEVIRGLDEMGCLDFDIMNGQATNKEERRAALSQPKSRREKFKMIKPAQIAGDTTFESLRQQREEDRVSIRRKNIHKAIAHMVARKNARDDEERHTLLLALSMNQTNRSQALKRISIGIVMRSVAAARQTVLERWCSHLPALHPSPTPSCV